MRAFIEHRGQNDFLGRRRRFVLHLHFTFSDEEKAIIAARSLDNYVFDLSPGYLASTESRCSKEALSGLQLSALAAFLISFPLLFVAAAVPAFAVPTLLCLFGAPPAFWWATLARRREGSAYTSKLSLRDLVASPTIAVQTDNPGLAPTLDEHIRARALSLKHFLTKTHDLASPRMFEL
jgi:hypothetical protein